MTNNDGRRPITPPSKRPGPDAPVPGATKVKSGSGKNKKVANSLVALGSAAIISVYGLGYVRTQSAAAYLNTDSPATVIATTPLQSPLLTPSATAVMPSATATSVPSVATTAPVSATKTPATATAATALYKDGTYTGTGTSRHGNISASVVVQGGKIVSAIITQCGTRYPCSDIAALPGQVVTRQSAAIDYVSGATDSSQAYRGAIQNALAKATA